MKKEKKKNETELTLWQDRVCGMEEYSYLVKKKREADRNFDRQLKRQGGGGGGGGGGQKKT